MSSFKHLPEQKSAPASVDVFILILSKCLHNKCLIIHKRLHNSDYLKAVKSSTPKAESTKIKAVCIILHQLAAVCAL